MAEKIAKVGIIMGSDSDLPTMKDAANMLNEFGISYEMKVVSAHRTPFDMIEYGKNAADRGLKVIIAGAGGAAHLPGMISATSILPVIGVPIQSKMLSGIDSLLSIVQMPAGVPTATVAIGAGKNAGILAAQIIATFDNEVSQKLKDYKKRLETESRNKNNLNPDLTK